MKILFCTDGSEISYYAIEKTLPLLKQHSQLDILHVVDNGILHTHLREDIEDDIVCKHILDKAAYYIESKEYIVANRYCLHGHPANIIIELLKKYDLTILGAHGRSGIASWLGSTTMSVISHSNTPIIMARPKKEGSPANSRKQILVIIDKSTYLDNKIIKIISNFDYENIDIELLTVIDSPETIPSELVMDETFLREVMTKEEKQAKENLDKVKEDFIVNKLRVVSVLTLKGNPAKVILDYVQKNPKDLVVIGSNNKSELECLLVGCVSRRVLDNIEGTVLIVPESN